MDIPTNIAKSKNMEKGQSKTERLLFFYTYCICIHKCYYIHAQEVLEKSKGFFIIVAKSY